MEELLTSSTVRSDMKEAISLSAFQRKAEKEEPFTLQLVKNFTLIHYKCSAVFGGGVYAYSNDPNKEIVISHCSFISNMNHQAQNEKPSGSAIYMNTVKSSIVSCKFKRNVGANSVRVVYNFPAKTFCCQRLFIRNRLQFKGITLFAS